MPTLLFSFRRGFDRFSSVILNDGSIEDLAQGEFLLLNLCRNACGFPLHS